MFSGCPFVLPCVRPREHGISETTWGNLIKFAVLVHLDTKMNC